MPVVADSDRENNEVYRHFQCVYAMQNSIIPPEKELTKHK